MHPRICTPITIRLTYKFTHKYLSIFIIPFDSYCGAEKGVISPEPMTAEYTSFNKCAKKCLQWQQFAKILGFPSIQTRQQ